MTTQTTSTARRGRVIVPAVAAADSSPELDALVGDLPSGTRDIPIDQLLPHPANPRRDVGDLSELAASIRAHGIQQNLLAVPDPGDPDRYRLVIGHRRHAAAALAGLATVPVRIDPSLTETQQRELMLLENIQRSDLTPVEEADGYQGLLDLGVPVKTLAKHVGRSQQTVRDRLTLAKAPETARTAVHDGVATLGDALLLADFEGTDAHDRLAGVIGTRDFAIQASKERAAALRRAAQDKLAEGLDELGVKTLHGREQIPDGYAAFEFRHQWWNAPSDLSDVDLRLATIRAAIEDGGTYYYLDETYSFRLLSPVPEEDVEAIAARAAEQAEREERSARAREADNALREFATAAASTRLAFVRDLISRTMPPGVRTRVMPAFVTHALRAIALADSSPSMTLLGSLVDVPAAGKYSTDWMRRQDQERAYNSHVLTHVQALPAVNALIALAFVHLEPESYREWTEHEETTIEDLYALLTELGYVPSTEETERLANRAAARTDALEHSDEDRHEDAPADAELLAEIGVLPAAGGDA